MSKTYENIQAAIKTAMKNGESLIRDTLRMVVSDIKNKTVNEGKEITEDVVVSCIKKFAKQCEDSIASANVANRHDLVEKAMAEKSVVSKFLPKMMTEQQMRELCEDLYAHSTDRNLGSLMKSLPATCDKKFCANVLKELLK